MSGPNRQLALEQYRRRARRYDRLAPLTRRLRRRAVGRLQLRAGQTVIDVACGTGLTFALLADQIGPDGSLVGIDLSPEMLSQARERVTAALAGDDSRQPDVGYLVGKVRDTLNSLVYERTRRRPMILPVITEV